jgi:DNA-binding GntR family transcriptional regulator
MNRLSDSLLEDDGTPETLRVDRSDQTLTRKVGNGLRSAILNGHFEPGQRLVERKLCELTGVSRTSVREALRCLEAEGLIVNIPNRGPTVALISEKEAEEIYVVRSMLESKAAELFVEHATEAKVGELRRSMITIEEAHRDGDLDVLLAAKKQYYAIILAGCRNDLISRTLRLLYAKITILRRTSMTQHNRVGDTVKEMRVIFDAIEARDVRAARRACVRHVERAAAVALEALRNERG